jgi:hypothetical protein
VTSATRNGETVLLDVRRGRYHTLNQAGSRVWELLGSGTTREAIVLAMRDEYGLPAGVSPDQVDRDVTAMLSALHAAGLLDADRVA